MTEIREVRPADGSVAFQDWYRALRTGLDAGRIETFFASAETLSAQIAEPSSSQRVAAFGAFEAGECVGGAVLFLQLRDNQQLATLALAVPPQHRGRGAGSALLRHAMDQARAEGRTSCLVLVRVPPGEEDGASVRFARRHGFTLRNTEIRRLLMLPLAADRLAELEAHAAERSGGYRLVSWVTVCPEEYLDGYANLRSLIGAEAPRGDVQIEAQRWDSARLREEERRFEAQGRNAYVTIAVAPDGTVVGYTGINVSQRDRERALQAGTLVLQAYRGHRLGLALKLANLRAMVAAEPGVRLIDTLNAEQNAPMVAVNVRLGFEIVDRALSWQRDL